MGSWEDKMNLVCFEPLHHERSWSLEAYRRIGGYDAQLNRIKAAGELQSVRIGRSRRIARADVVEFVERLRADTCG